MRTIPVSLAFSLILAACSGGGTPEPAHTAGPTAAFQPAAITVHAKAYDYFGVLAYTAVTAGVPKPIDPANGSLACNDGYFVPLQIRSGPDELDLVRDQYVVLPLLASPPAGTTLTCKSTWGLYDASGTLLASTVLNATVVYDATGTAIAFSPSTATVHAAGGDAPIYLQYTSMAGFSVTAVTPADGSLSCPGGYAPKTQLRAGPAKSGLLQEQFVIETASISPPAGTSLACSAVWGLLDANGNDVAQATLAVTLLY